LYKDVNEKNFWSVERYIQNSTKKLVDIPLHHMLDLVMTCICLPNMCIANLNGFDMEWALEVQKDAQIEANTTFGKLIFLGWLNEQSNK